MINEEAKLKKVLGLSDAMGIATGQIIGAGIMALTGIGIAMTGTGVAPAFVLSSIFTVITTLPIAIMGATLPTTGGLYRYSSRLLSPKVGFFYLLLFLLAQITLAMFAISFAQYMQGLLPNAPVNIVAFALITAFYIANLFGVKTAAIIQNIMVIVLFAALLVFIGFGFPKINWSVFTVSQMLPNGYRGFFTAVGLLAFATGGGQVIAELGGEMKNPSRDIPLTIITCTIGVGVLYAFMASTAAGILPVSEVAGKPLTDVAKAVLPTPLFIFFIVGGAMFALATTLNATFSWVTKGMLIACEDGWLPKKLGAVNEKYGTPHWLLTLFYLFGVIPIIFGISLETISALGTGVILFGNVIPVIASTQLAKKFPDQFSKSSFKFPPIWINIIAIVAVLLLVFQGYLLLSTLSKSTIIGVIIYMAAAAAYVAVVGKNRKQMENF